MRLCAAIGVLLALESLTIAQAKPARPSDPKVVTVPATIDHNRAIIDVKVPTLKGTTESIRAWIDTGESDLVESRRIGMAGGLVECMGQMCSAPAPTEIVVGDIEMSIGAGKSAVVPLDSLAGLTGVIPGVKAEMNLPSSVLRHYDVLVDFPGRKVTIGTPGSIHFNGVPAKVKINPDTGVISVPSKIDNKKYDLDLDLGASMSLLTSDVFAVLPNAHPDWPQMTGEVGPASEWGTDLLKCKIIRLDRLQFGPLFLANVAVADVAKGMLGVSGKLVAPTGRGALGSQALQNYRIGIDYAHSTVYFDLGRTFNFPDFDVIGLILRPEYDGGFTILGVADFEGKPSVATGPEGVQAGDHLVAVNGIPVAGSSLGQVWSMLGGTPGQERKLTVERAGKQLDVMATVEHFLPEVPDEPQNHKRK